MDTLEEVMANRGQTADSGQQESKPEAEAPATPETAPQGPARDEQGRFAQQQQRAEAEAAEAAAGQPSEGTQPQGVVPRQALHASRQSEREAKEEAAAARREVAELRAQMQGFMAAAQRPQAAPQAPPQPRVYPDVLADPEGYAKAVLDDADERIRNARDEDQRKYHLRTCHSAQRKYGQEFDAAWNAAKDYARTNPLFEQELQAADDLGEHLVDWHRRRQIVAEVGADPAAYRERIRQEILAEQRGTNGAPPAAAAPPGTRPNGQLPTSFAAAQNSGRASPGLSGPLSLEDIMKR